MRAFLWVLLLVYIGSVVSPVKAEEQEKEQDGVSDLVVMDWGQWHSIKVSGQPVAVFLKLYAPWCGHCKRMQAAWEEVATKAAKADFGDVKVVIAEWNVDARKTGGDAEAAKAFSVQGFPTVIAKGLNGVSFNQNDKMVDRVDHLGPRDVDSLWAWVEETVKTASVVSAEKK